MILVALLARTLLFFFLSHISVFADDTITLDHPIEDNGNVIVSGGKIFALGFFSPGKSRNRYVGIWYYQIPDKAVVWVANRENPINDTSGILSIDSRGNLALFQRNQTHLVWSTNISITGTRNSTAQLLDTGNLLLLQNDARRTVLWQSFDYPGNTILPSMKTGFSYRTGLNRFATSWRSPDDPGIGNYSFRINPTSGFPQSYLYKGSSPFWRAGSWTGQRWSGIPEMKRNKILTYSFVNNDEEVSFTIWVSNASIITRVVTNETGKVNRLAWNNEAHRWVVFFAGLPQEQCDFYLHCGPNSYCNPNYRLNFECICFPGFEPKLPREWYLSDGARGCIRKSGVSTCRSGEGFMKIARVKVPDTLEAKVDMNLGLKSCKDKCLRNCSCVAYASAYYESNGGAGCLTWHGDLVDARIYTDSGQDLYIRVDADELVHSKKKGLLHQKGVLAA